MAIDEAVYSLEQKLAWCSVDGDLTLRQQFWQQRFAKTRPLVAVDKYDHAIGFIEFLAQRNHLGERVVDQGYIDCLYVHPNYQHQGVAQMLYQQAVMASAELSDSTSDSSINSGIKKIWVHTSAIAKPFFSRQGFECVAKQNAIRQGVQLENWLMQKSW